MRREVKKSGMPIQRTTRIKIDDQQLGQDQNRLEVDVNRLIRGLLLPDVP
jgi:hypothetical protein